MFPGGFYGRPKRRWGQQIKDYGCARRSAVKRAGWPQIIVHDLRRSFVRNAIGRGLHPTVIMSITVSWLPGSGQVRRWVTCGQLLMLRH